MALQEFKFDPARLKKTPLSIVAGVFLVLMFVGAVLYVYGLQNVSASPVFGASWTDVAGWLVVGSFILYMALLSLEEFAGTGSVPKPEPVPSVNSQWQSDGSE